MLRPLGLLITLAAVPLLALAGDIETQALDLGKKLATIAKFTESQARPFVVAPDDIRKEFFKHYGDIKFSDDNRVIFVLAVLKSEKDETVRAGAASWLANLRPNKAVFKPLIDLLSDKSPAVRAAAAEGLIGYRGDPTLGVKYAKLLNDESNDVRQAAVKALGKLNDRKQTAAIIAAYKKFKKDGDEDAAFGETLALLGENEISLEIARTCLKSRNLPARTAAISAIECNPSMKVIPVIMDNLVRELYRTTALDSSKKDWDVIYVTMCSELVRRTGKNYNHDAIGWCKWWDGVREQYKAPPLVFDEAIVSRWMDAYRKMGPSKIKE